MNKITKASCGILVCCIVLAIVFYIPKQVQLNALPDVTSIEGIQLNKKTSKQTSSNDESFDLLDGDKKSFEQVNSSEGSLKQTNMDEGSKLTNSDKNFLEEHVFGQWKFSKRLIPLNESYNNYYDTVSNFSEECVEMLIEFAVLAYSEDLIYWVVEPDQSSFPNPIDAYLFGKHGAFELAYFPDYHIKDRASKTLKLWDPYNAYAMTGGNPISFPKEMNLISVYLRDETPAFLSKSFGDNLFIDPNDKDTLYLDFCGLWELKRDEINYSTKGKSKY